MKRNIFFVLVILLLVSCTSRMQSGSSRAGRSLGGGWTRGENQVAVEEPTIGLQVVTRAMPKEGGVVDQERGKEVWLAVGPVSGVGDTPANGVVQAHYFEDETYLFTAQVNINMAPDGSFYEGWLTRRSPLSAILSPVALGAKGEAQRATADGEGGLSEPISVGHLRSRFGDVRHWLEFESDQDFRDIVDVRFTLETDDGDPTVSDNVVAEGVLKVRTRY